MNSILVAWCLVVTVVFDSLGRVLRRGRSRGSVAAKVTKISARATVGPLIDEAEFDALDPGQVVALANGDQVALFTADAEAVVEAAAVVDRQIAQPITRLETASKFIFVLFVFFVVDSSVGLSSTA